METEDLQALEGLEHTFTDGEKVYGRIFPNEENSNLTEMGKHLAKEVKKNPSKFTRQYDDNMISGDDGTKIAQKQPNTPNIPEEVIIIPHFPKKKEEEVIIIPHFPKKKEEEVIITRQSLKKEKLTSGQETKEVADEATTGKNIVNSTPSGVNNKTLITELSGERVKEWNAKNDEAREHLKRQNGQQRD